MPTKILVTGGTGFVGWWMQRTQPEGLKVTYLNLLDYHESHWEWAKWDYIVHLANISPLWITYNHSGRILYASSGAVYAGTGEYADNKRKYENMLDPDKCVIARLFTFVGSHLKNLYAVTNFIENARNKEPIIVQGNGLSVRTYLHGEDLGRWMWKLLFDGQGIYDVGSSMEWTIREVAELVASIATVPVYVKNNPGVPNTRYVPDTRRINEFGCRESIGLKQAIERELCEHK